MVAITSLWLPILLAAVLVFAASSVIHMWLNYHANDLRELPSEDAVMDALRGFDIPPGDYVMPHAGSAASLKDPEFQAKLKAGPVAYMTVLPNGPMAMGSKLVQWFIYCIVVGLFAAYIAGRALGPGAEYLSVFRFTGCTAFVGYGLAMVQDSIWMNKSWSATLKSLFDALVYGLLTAGAFGWLWPAA
jgi:hypothetical protein